MLNRAIVVALAIAAAVPAAAQSVVPVSAYRAQHIAVGITTASQYGKPVAVEATLDGWVYVTALTSIREGPAFPFPNQAIVEARDVRAWATNARATLAQPPGESRTTLPALGRGTNTLRVDIGSRQFPNAAVVVGCRKGSTGSNVSREELSKLVELLDSAAAIAGLGEARAPTLSRPYYGSEVSCPATPASDNPLPIAPPSFHGALPDVGAGFVVDTTGRVELGSIRILGATNTAIARSVRTAIAGWRFDPADWDGTPLRQFVQTAVSFTKDPPPPTILGESKATLALTPTDDGFVRFDILDVYGRPLHEWFTPRDVDAWVKQIDTKAMRDSALHSQYRVSWYDMGVDSGFVLNGAWARFGATGDSLIFRVSVRGCDLDQTSGGRVDPPPPLAAFRAAAAAARKRRATPLINPTLVRERTEVSCPARFFWQPVTARIARGSWIYPVGAYSEAMATNNARIETLVSFVVDTLGHPDPRSIQIMPGSDPRAISRVRQSIDGLHFRGALRGRRHVAQRMIYLVRFEPPPVCRGEYKGPLCARSYSNR